MEAADKGQKGATAGHEQFRFSVPQMAFEKYPVESKAK